MTETPIEEKVYSQPHANNAQPSLALEGATPEPQAPNPQQQFELQLDVAARAAFKVFQNAAGDAADAALKEFERLMPPASPANLRLYLQQIERSYQQGLLTFDEAQFMATEARNALRRVFETEGLR